MGSRRMWVVAAAAMAAVGLTAVMAGGADDGGVAAVRAGAPGGDLGPEAMADERAAGQAAEGQAQPEEAPPEEREERVLGEGSNNSPAGPLALLTYRVTEVRLSRPVDATVEGRRVRTDRAYRLRVTGGPFPVRDMPARILVNGLPVGVGQEAPDLGAVSVRVMDRSLLADGATVAVEYGPADGSYSELPERLDLED